MIPFPYQTGQLGRRAVPADAGSFPTSGLISYWGFDDGSGTNVNDDFGSNDGTFVNSPTWSTDAKLGTNSIDFSGAVNKGVSTAITYNSANDLTVGMWVKRTGTNDLRMCWSWQTSNSLRYIFLIHRADRSGLTIQIANGGSASFIDAGQSLTVGTYFLIGLSRSGSTTKIWVDGVEKASASFSLLSTTGNFIIGNRAANYDLSWDGLIDEPFYFNRALTSSEWLDIYNSGAGRKP
jgi:hypothetical protein